MSTSSPTRLKVDIKAPFARVTLTNPPLNVIELRMTQMLLQTLAEIESRTDISSIVLEGAGAAFSAGVDIKAHLPEKIQGMLTSFHAVIRALVASHKITIAVVRGTCLGGGAELAGVCDMVYTARDAVWGFPEIKLGCYPPVATVALPALVGQKRACELILTGRQISGEEAAVIGLANRAVGAEELGAVVEETLGSLQAMSASALAYAKKSIYAWDAIHFDKGL